MLTPLINRKISAAGGSLLSGATLAFIGHGWLLALGVV
ncbi:hypothetical protein RNAN_1930 [Rheinheimera nanhaiensis E407-8]|uniref:Uncharacterized protein n=1 Tax=Rheinheimera nanhaiensis E407-8 TaxID=562729 RepID=I1DY14_9GAMM|nr:hypothetical protein RNAN_1930 [Rheinheimera nanhaiensis E407-8]